MEKLIDVLLGVSGPHKEAEVFVTGEVSKKALILIHGRGGSATDIATLTQALSGGVYTLLPEAVHHVWYPERFLVPQAQNQPELDSALELIAALLGYLEKQGIKKEAVIIAGFSQGACLTAEYIKRHPGTYGGAVLMSGGFIGSDEEAAIELLDGSLLETPIYIGCDREDAHIPLERVEVTAKGLTAAGATVSLELFSGYGHRPHSTAIQFLESCLQS